MLQGQVHVINTILMAIDAACVIFAGYGAFYTKRYSSGGIWSMDTPDFVVSVLFVMFLNNYLLGKADLYSDRRSGSLLSLMWSLIKVVVVSFAALMAGMFILKDVGFSRLFVMWFGVFTFAFILIHRIIFRMHLNRMARGGFNSRNIIVVANEDRGNFVSDFLGSQLSWGHQVVGRVEPSPGLPGKGAIGRIEDLEMILRQRAIDEVIFAIDGDRGINLNVYLELCRRVGVEVRILPALWQPGDTYLSAERCQDIPFLTMRATNINATGLLYKRIFDFVGGLVGTLFFFMIYPFVAIAIWFDCPGPILYKQKRIGQNGREFNLYKFRSMCLDADKQRELLMSKNKINGHMFKIDNDPRITKLGRWLRRTSLDEVPQFLNVLRGEMSLVGTRPPMPDEVDQYQLEHLKRIAAKPGITGLWQISGRSKIEDFEKVVELDCSYMDCWRFYDDVKIIAKTIWVVLHRKGAV